MHRAHHRGEPGGDPDGRACSAPDPIATARIEDLIDELRQSYAICIVTHSMQQAARVSQRTAYFHLGELVEVGETDRISPTRAPADRGLHQWPLRLSAPVRAMAEQAVEIEGHTSRAFDGEISALHVQVVEMGGLLLLQVREAANVYTDWDTRLARTRCSSASTWSTSLPQGRRAGARAIARRQPVAGDLRTTIAMSKIVAELERAGDEARKIGQVLGWRRRADPPRIRDRRDARHPRGWRSTWCARWTRSTGSTPRWRASRSRSTASSTPSTLAAPRRLLTRARRIRARSPCRRPRAAEVAGAGSATRAQRREAAAAQPARRPARQAGTPRCRRSSARTGKDRARIAGDAPAPGRSSG